MVMQEQSVGLKDNELNNAKFALYATHQRISHNVQPVEMLRVHRKCCP